MFAIDLESFRHASPRDEVSHNRNESYCNNCQNWFPNARWIHRPESDTVFYPASGGFDKLYEKGVPDSDSCDVVRVDGPASERGEFWECPQCYSYIRELNDEDEDEDQDAYDYLCGVCGEGWYDLGEAQGCCSHLDNPQPNPALFANLGGGE